MTKLILTIVILGLGFPGTQYRERSADVQWEIKELDMIIQFSFL